MKGIGKATVVALLAAAAVLPAAPARAQALQLTTPYPGVAVQAGKSVNLDIKAITSSPRRVDLAVVETPPGWRATLRGGGFVISAVFGQPKDPPSVTLEILVPADAKPGDYRVVLRGSSGGVTDTLPIVVRVSEQGTGAISLTTDFPTLRGQSTQTFTFRVTLSNNTPEKTTFNLAAEGPRGWRVEARPTAETRAATATVDPGSTTTIEVEADPPDDVTAGRYPITLRVTGGGQTAETKLEVEITGNVDLEVSTSTDRLNITGHRGRPTKVLLVIRNKGTAPARNVRLSSSPPTGWQVRFAEETIAEVPAKRERRVEATVIPSGNAVAGDYMITITASGDGASKNVELRMTVQPSRFWILVALLVIAGAALGLRNVFKKYGRR